MAAPRFLISENDNDLLEAGRRLNHPEEIGPLIARIPEGGEKGVVIAVYDIVRDDSRGKGHCALCHKTANHWKGAVLQFADGSHASIGRCCCENTQEVAFKELLTAFDEDTTRGNVICQVQVAIESLESACGHILSIPGRPTAKELAEMHERLKSRFVKLFEYLRESKGLLLIEKGVADYEELAERRKRRERKIDSYVDRFKAKNGQKEPTVIEINAAFLGDADFSTEPKMKKETQKYGSFPGVSLFTIAGRLDCEVQSIANRLIQALTPLDGATSGTISTIVLRKCVSEFQKALGAGIKLIEQVNEAIQFLDSDNLAAIVRWANLRPDLRSGETYTLKGKTLAREYNDQNPITLAISEILPEIEVGPLSRIRLSVQGRGSDIEIPEAA